MTNTMKNEFFSPGLWPLGLTKLVLILYNFNLIYAKNCLQYYAANKQINSICPLMTFVNVPRRPIYGPLYGPKKEEDFVKLVPKVL